jgi:hypothetical protein
MMTYSIFATKGDIPAAVFVRGSVSLLRTIPTKEHNLKTFNQTFDKSCQYKNQVHEIMAGRKNKLRYSEENP